MNLKEVKLYRPMKQWFLGRGYTVRPEVSILFRSFDAIAIKENIVIAIEMKMSLTKGLLGQIRTGNLFADFSYVVIGTRPRENSENLSICWGKGIGILSIKNGEIKELCPSKKNNSWLEQYHERAIEYAKQVSDKGEAGKPWLKGEGPAQAVQKMIIKYRKTHPDATWKELYKNIPNHYCSYRSMQGAMGMVGARAYSNLGRDNEKQRRNA